MRKRFDYSHSSPTCALGSSHPRDKRELFVICCGFDKCRPDYLVSRTSHPIHVLEYIYRGEGELHGGGRSWRLQGGMVFFYGPGAAHEYRTHAVNRLEKLWICYAGTGAAAIAHENLGPTCGALRLAEPNEVMRVCEAIADEIVNKTVYSQAICDALLRVLLLTVAANRLPDAPGTARAQETFHECKAFIDARYESMVSPFEACGRFRISPSYLCRLFRRFSGHTPHAYLTTLKLNSAAYQLVTSAVSVKEVAALLNYADAYTFSRVFKRFFGVSPQRYREPTQAIPLQQ
jgi:AraC-like DNA-binding protein